MQGAQPLLTSIYLSIYLVKVQAESVQGAQPALTYLSVYLSIYLSIYLSS